MLITALCPYCRSVFQVQASLRGQMMRCPNAGCRKVFAVPKEEPPSGTSLATPRPSSPPENGQRSGAVGDMVPILPAEQVVPPAPSASTSKHVSEILPLAPPEAAAPPTEARPGEGNWWQAAPPVRQAPSQPDAPSSPPPSVAESLRDSERSRGATAPPPSVAESLRDSERSRGATAPPPSVAESLRDSERSRGATAPPPSVAESLRDSERSRGATAPPPSVAESLRDSERSRGATAPPPPATGATWWRETPPPARNPQAPAASSAPPSPPQTRRSARISLTPAEPSPPIPPLPSADKETQQMPSFAAEAAEQPRQLPPGVWEPPPVRRDVAGQDHDAPPVEAAPESETHRPRLSKRRAWLAIASLVLLTLAVLGGACVWVSQILSVNEESLSKKAREDYGIGAYVNAAQTFRLLDEKYPQSDRRDEYRFLAKWCDVCKVVSDRDADPAASLPILAQFVDKNKTNHFMGESAHDAGQQLRDLAKRLAERNANPPDEQPLKAVEGIEQLRRTVASINPEALTKEDTASIEAELDKVRRAVERANKRRDVLVHMRKGDEETWMDAINRVRKLLAGMRHELPGIEQDAEVEAAKSALYQGHQDSVVFHPRRQDIPPPPPDDDVKWKVFAELLPTAAPGKAPPDDPIVLAVVRGVLYALKQSNGEVLWATRVGIDTTALPLRVPASRASPELLLVLSADTQTLAAMTVNGKELWEYPIGQRVLGRPIIIDHRAYLAAYDGWVHEIELSQGQLLGRWYLGQRLTCGGAREGKTGRLYFPADDSCTYVVDVSRKERRCVGILYDGHHSGSLRSEPVIVPPVGETAPGYLILNVADSLDAMQLQVFELPIQERRAKPLPLKPEARLDGWTWFEPSQDGEKLAILSDAGLLGLFGIRQMGNRDQPLFPLLPKSKEDLLAKDDQHGLNLSPFLRKKGEGELPGERGRAQVVHMWENDFWVLAHGRFQQVHVGRTEKRGPQAKAVWKEPLTLGSPLHEPQRVEERDSGQSTFILVTQALQQQTCLTTAVDQQGQIRWQRQLGLVCQSAPLALTPPEGGPPLFVALDQSGGLFALDPLRPKTSRVLAEALDDNPRMSPRLLPSPDLHSAYEVAAPGEGRSLLVRRIDWVNGTRELHVVNPPIRVSWSPVHDKSVDIPAGQPALVGTQLLVPMRDGRLRRLLLAEEDKWMRSGPPWRDDLAPATASCHVLALGGDRFLVTDGGRSLRVYEWPAAPNKNYLALPKGGETFTRLEYLIAAPPVLLPSREGRPRIAVADSANELHLFTMAQDGSLQAGLIWELKGKITMGPFVHTTAKGEVRLGCVVDRASLVWIDPDKEESLWTYPGAGAALIGPPTRIDDLLVLALQSGQYVGLDPETGQRKGDGYTLRSSSAPAATPMPFDSGRMFAPLSDGTALLLPIELLRKPAKK